MIKIPRENNPESPNMTPFIDVTFQLLIFFILTLHLRQFEGRLVSHLPQGPGPDYDVIRDEVRIYLCVDGDLKRHAADKAHHDAERRPVRRVTLAVEGEVIAVLPPLDAPRDAFRRAALRAAEIRVPRALLRIDADSEVPYDHVIALLNER